MWEYVKYVGTGLTLVAFITAAALFAYRARLASRAKVIETAPKAERVHAIAAEAEFFDVDTRGLSPDQIEKIVLEQIRMRARRDLFRAAIAIIATVLFAIVTIVAILSAKTSSSAAAIDKSREGEQVRSTTPPATPPTSACEGPRILTTLTAGKIITRDIKGNNAGELSDIGLTIFEECPGAPKRYHYQLRYSFFNGSMARGGTQTVTIHLLAEGRALILPLTFQLDRSYCVRNAPHPRTQSGDLPDSTRLIKSMEIAVSTVMGDQERCY